MVRAVDYQRLFPIVVMPRWFLIALAFVISASVSAQGLFSDALPPAYFTADSFSAKRARFVSVDVAALEKAPHQLHLNLFADADVQATVHRVREETGHFAWSGTVDADGGHVLLSVRGDHVVGRILVGGRVYVVRPAPGGHVLYEAEPEGASDKDDAVEVEAPEAPAVFEKAAGGGAETFDVLVVWTTDAEAELGGAAEAAAYASGAVDLYADVLSNSGLSHTARLVHATGLAYTSGGVSGEDLARLQDPSDGVMDEVHAIRDLYGADFVVLIAGQEQTQCGLGYLQAPLGEYFEAWAFSVASVRCGIDNLTIPHEIGHNMGVRHDPYVDPATTPVPYAHGWIVPSNVPSERFRTVLAYDDVCLLNGYSCPRVPYYSDPGRLYQGRPMGSAATANATRHINEVAATLAAFRPTVVTEAAFVLTVTQTSDPASVKPGGRFDFDVTFATTASGPTSVQYWTEAIRPNGESLSAIDPTTIALTPGGTTTVSRRQRIPPVVPAGTYTYLIHAGTYPDDIQASETVVLEIAPHPTPAGMESGLQAWDEFAAPEAKSLDAEAPLTVALHAPVPNPSSGAMEVAYTLSAAGPVHLSVHDALGRRVAVLASGAGMEAGSHTTPFDVSALAPGVYVVRLEAGGTVAVQHASVVR